MTETTKKTNYKKIVGVTIAVLFGLWVLNIVGFLIYEEHRKKETAKYLEKSTIENCEKLHSESSARVFRISPFYKDYPFYKDCLARGFVYTNH